MKVICLVQLLLREHTFQHMVKVGFRAIFFLNIVKVILQDNTYFIDSMVCRVLRSYMTMPLREKDNLKATMEASMITNFLVMTVRINNLVPFSLPHTKM